ncbi:MAG: ammonium transporter [Burkholderiales bacterium]
MQILVRIAGTTTLAVALTLGCFDAWSQMDTATTRNGVTATKAEPHLAAPVQAQLTAPPVIIIAQAQDPAHPGASHKNAAGTSKTSSFNGADTAWMLISTVLVLLMTMPGIILFYAGMFRTKNALSIVAHTIAATAVITLTWSVIGYSLAFTAGTPWLGGVDRVLADGLIGKLAGAHVSAPTIPESVFFLFHLAFAIIAFALILGATAERMRLGVTMVFAVLWITVVYAPVAHWVWHPNGWLALRGHMDFAGGTVVHIAAGISGLSAAWVLGPRLGFGREPMVPYNLMITVVGGGLLWAGWFGFNAGSAFEASGRAAGALLATQVAACCGAILWGFCEYIQRGQWSVLGTLTGAIAGLIAITPASGFVGVDGALAIGAAAGAICFIAVVNFKRLFGIDDSLDVFALHGVGGIIGTVLTPVFATPAVAPVTATVLTNTLGAFAVMAYAGISTVIILRVIAMFVNLRVDAAAEKAGLDVTQHGEMLAPNG